MTLSTDTTEPSHSKAIRAQFTGSGSLPRHRRTLAVGTAIAAGVLTFTGISAEAALATTPADTTNVTFSPMSAYRNWNVVSFGDLTMSAESEGAVAAGGSMSFTGTQVATHSTSNAVGLLTGGRIDWASSSGTLQVLNSASVRIGDMSNAVASDTDSNGASQNTVVTPMSATVPAVRTTKRSDAAAVASPGMFEKEFSQADAVSDANRVATAAATAPDDEQVSADISAAAATLDLHAGTNYWTVSAAKLSAIRGITFTGHEPDAADPLIIRVTGDDALTLNLTMAGARDPEGILFDAPNVPSITQSGDSIDGSILAPEAAYTKTSANVQGTIVVAEAHLAGSEEHYFPFVGSISTPGEDAPTPGGSASASPSASVPPFASASPSDTASASAVAGGVPSSRAASRTVGTHGKSRVPSAPAVGASVNTGGALAGNRIQSWIPIGLIALGLGLGAVTFATTRRAARR